MSQLQRGRKRERDRGRTATQAPPYPTAHSTTGTPWYPLYLPQPSPRQPISALARPRLTILLVFDLFGA